MWKGWLQMTKMYRELCFKCLDGFIWAQIHFQVVALNCSDANSHKTQTQRESTKSGSSRFSMKHLQKLSWWHMQTGAFLSIDSRAQNLQHIWPASTSGCSCTMCFTGNKCNTVLLNRTKYHHAGLRSIWKLVSCSFYLQYSVAAYSCSCLFSSW